MRQDEEREDEREKRRQDEEKMKGRMKEKNEEKRKEGKDDFFPKNVSEPSNPPEELAQNVSKKIPVGRIIPPFFFESAESGRF